MNTQFIRLFMSFKLFNNQYVRHGTKCVHTMFEIIHAIVFKINII